MKILFIVYHDLSTEARSCDFLNALELLSNEVICICRKGPINSGTSRIISIGEGSHYFKFIHSAKHYINIVHPDILVLHDEFTAPLIKYAIRKCNPYIVYDSSELNVGRKLPGIKNWICKALYKVEAMNLKRCNLVFAANEERLEIMSKAFALQNEKAVFDNIHRIDDDYDSVQCEKKYGKYLFNGKKILVYGGGIAYGRYTFKIIDEFKNNKDYDVIIVGSASKACCDDFCNKIEKEKIKNIHYLGFVSRSELRYLFANALASFVLFDTISPNTKYCASGKLFESLFEGTPIICSDNPPLVRLCANHRIGEAGMDYVKSANLICKNIKYYKKNISEFINGLDYDNRVNNLAQTIIGFYEKAK